MKENKFRFWNRAKKRYEENMLNGLAYGVTNDGVILLNVEVGTFRDTSLVEEQFTGLKDKNEKDIYEGDCVRFELHDGATVIWNSTEARFEFKANKHYCESDITQSCEIIGNIHENTELISIRTKQIKDGKA